MKNELVSKDLNRQDMDYRSRNVMKEKRNKTALL
jgi:hypothetical protein